LFDSFKVKPTYLITYPVCMDEGAVSLLKRFYDADKCDIGAQLHPWNTPPFDEEATERNSMLCNLPPELQYKKIECLSEAIQQRFGIQPVSFRAGRWGYNKDITENLHRLGYKIDSSVTPYIDWTKQHGPDFSAFSPKPYKLTSSDIRKELPCKNLIEVPVTIGFLQQSFGLINLIYKTLQRNPVNSIRLLGILSRLRLINKVWLSPEVADSKMMIKLTRNMMENNYPLINMTFHSCSLKAGLTPFVRTKEDEKRFRANIEEYLTFTTHAGIESIKLADVQWPL
jgi:hypothetical protein